MASLLTSRASQHEKGTQLTTNAAQQPSQVHHTQHDVDGHTMTSKAERYSWMVQACKLPTCIVPKGSCLYLQLHDCRHLEKQKVPLQPSPALPCRPAATSKLPAILACPKSNHVAYLGEIWSSYRRRRGGLQSSRISNYASRSWHPSQGRRPRRDGRAMVRIQDRGSVYLRISRHACFKLSPSVRLPILLPPCKAVTNAIFTTRTRHLRFTLLCTSMHSAAHVRRMSHSYTREPDPRWPD